MKLNKSSFGRLIAFILCFVMTFTFIPFIDSEGTTANAETQTPIIELGDYVQMGTYYGEPILWRCVAFYPVANDGTVELTNPTTEYQEGYLPLMLSDEILCMKAFDAAGSSDNTSATSSHFRGYNNGNRRQDNGSNYWGDSNIRCWLNSDVDQITTWPCGNAPSLSNLFYEKNDPYDQEKGFLKSFTDSEKNCMKVASQYHILDQYEGLVDESITGTVYKPTLVEKGVGNFDELYRQKLEDRIFLLDLNQYLTLKANCDDENVNLEEDYYVGKISAGCAQNTKYYYWADETAEIQGIKSYLEKEQEWNYWLSSASRGESDSSNTYGDEVYYVENTKLYTTKSTYTRGIRPAFYLDISFSNFVSGDGSEDAPYSLDAGPTVTVDFANEQTNQNINTTILYKKKGDDTVWRSGTGGKINLDHNATYYFKYETATAAEKKNYAVTAITIPKRPATPSNPTVKRQTDTTVTLEATAGYEYKCDVVGGSEGNWQDSNVFKGLEAGKSYTFYQRVKATDSSFCSEESEKVVYIKYAAPTVSYRTLTSITLKPIEGYLYKCGENGYWQDSNEFTGLEKGKTYTFYQKKEGAEDTYASEPLKVKTLTCGDVITSAVGITGVTAYLAAAAKNKLISKWFLTSNGIFGKKVNSWVKNFWTNMMR